MFEVRVLVNSSSTETNLNLYKEKIPFIATLHIFQKNIPKGTAKFFSSISKTDSPI